MQDISPSVESSQLGKPKPRWSLPRGKLLRRVLRSDPSIEYITYIPRIGSFDAPVFVAVHGASRNWEEHAKAFVDLCEAHGVVLLAPNFGTEQHKDYQRLGRAGRGQRADLSLNSCLQEIASLSGADATQIYLFGYSGGAQFAHRYLMAYPYRVARAVVASAGWYTFPDATRRYPYGIRSTRKLPGVILNPEQFLRAPVTVLVGEQDVDLAGVRSTARLNEQQGLNRLDRAKNWVAAMQNAAQAFGTTPNVRYEEVPAVGHAFADFLERGALVQRVFHALFEANFEAAETGATHREETAINGAQSAVALAG